MTHYHIDGFYRVAEEDIFNAGCVGKAQQSCVEHAIDSDCLANLIERAARFLGVTDKDCILINSCDENGRIDFQVYEDENGCPASDYEIEQWKQGKQRLWLCTYTCYPEVVTPVGEIEQDILEHVNL